MQDVIQQLHLLPAVPQFAGGELSLLEVVAAL